MGTKNSEHQQSSFFKFMYVETQVQYCSTLALKIVEKYIFCGF